MLVTDAKSLYDHLSKTGSVPKEKADVDRFAGCAGLDGIKGCDSGMGSDEAYACGYVDEDHDGNIGLRAAHAGGLVLPYADDCRAGGGGAP